MWPVEETDPVPAALTEGVGGDLIGHHPVSPAPSTRPLLDRLPLAWPWTCSGAVHTMTVYRVYRMYSVQLSPHPLQVFVYYTCFVYTLYSVYTTQTDTRLNMYLNILINTIHTILLPLLCGAYIAQSEE